MSPAHAVYLLRRLAAGCRRAADNTPTNTHTGNLIAARRRAVADAYDHAAEIVQAVTS